MLKANEISDILEMQLREVDTKMAFEEVGTVMEVGDGVAHVFGLDNVQANELLEFENGVRGVAMNLEEDNVGVILMNAGDRVKENYTVKRTGSIASIKVGEGLLGRVVNTLGEPIDGAGPIEGELLLLPLERKAPGSNLSPAGEGTVTDRNQGDRFHGADRAGTAGANHRRPSDRKDLYCRGYDLEPEKKFR